MFFRKRNSKKYEQLPPWTRARSRDWSIEFIAAMVTLMSVVGAASPRGSYWLVLLPVACWAAVWYLNRTVVPFALDRPATKAQLEKLAETYLIAVSDSQKSVTPPMFYAKVLKLVSENFLYKDQAADLLRSLEHLFDAHLTTMEDACQAIQYAVRLLDRWSFVNDSRERRRNEREWAKQDVVHFDLKDNIGYIKLVTFHHQRVVPEFRAALQEMSAADAFIFDLRGDRGGYLDVALDILSMLLDGGTLCTEENNEGVRQQCVLTESAITCVRDGEIVSERPRQANLIGNKALVVLVDRYSGSASELVAGALKDLGRAKLVGEPTFGKGVGQNSWLLDFGAVLKLTAVRVYTPSGRCINGVGVFPHRLVGWTRKGDAALQEALKVVGSQKTGDSAPAK